MATATRTYGQGVRRGHRAAARADRRDGRPRRSMRSREAMRCLIQRDIEGAAARRRGRQARSTSSRPRSSARAVQLIALRAPMADDLREVVAALKIAGVVERIGDYAKNIAKRVPLLEKRGKIEPLSLLPAMARIAAEMVHDVLDAFAARDAAKARRGVRARPRGRRFLQQHLPHAADLHDGKPAQHQPVRAPAVRRQEPRADRRPCDQHRRDGLLSPRPASTWPTAARARTTDGGRADEPKRRCSWSRTTAALAELLDWHFEREDFDVEPHRRRRGGAAARRRECRPTSSCSTG